MRCACSTASSSAAQSCPHTPEALAAWVAELEREFAGRPVAVMLEQSHGGLAHALTQFPQLVRFPINPQQAARYREALANSGKKDDPLAKLYHYRAANR